MSHRDLELDSLRRELGDDPDGVALSSLVERLSAGKSRLTQALDAGVGSDDFKRLSRMRAAYEAAIGALPALWKSLNQR